MDGEQGSYKDGVRGNNRGQRDKDSQRNDAMSLLILQTSDKLGQEVSSKRARRAK